jgi:ADP-ribosylglycohydrolase
MIGAIIGDIVGSIYEGNPSKTTEFPLYGMKTCYTDDTVLTVAVAQAVLRGTDYGECLKLFGKKYTAGYGARFYDWAHSQDSAPYNSWGNGSAMRVSPIGFAYDA